MEASPEEEASLQAPRETPDSCRTALSLLLPLARRALRTGMRRDLPPAKSTPTSLTESVGAKTPDAASPKERRRLGGQPDGGTDDEVFLGGEDQAEPAAGVHEVVQELRKPPHSDRPGLGHDAQ